MSNSEAPVCVAVVICDQLIEDKRSNNKSLIGLFNAIQVPQLPATHSRLCIMASITNGSGDVPIKVLVRAPSGREVVKAEGTIHPLDPLAVLDVVFELNSFPIEELGTYMIDVFSGSHYLGGRRFQVIGTWLQSERPEV